MFLDSTSVRRHIFEEILKEYIKYSDLIRRSFINILFYGNILCGDGMNFFSLITFQFNFYLKKVNYLNQVYYIVQK